MLFSKEEAIGLLAGGGAHDLNNILSGVVSYPDLLLLQLPEGSQMRKQVLAIQQSGQRAAEIVANLSATEKSMPRDNKTFNLSELKRLSRNYSLYPAGISALEAT